MTNTTHTPHENAVMGLMRHLTSNDEAKLQSLMDWMAFPLQPIKPPRVKLNQALVFGGPVVNGKSILQQTLADIYHEDAHTIGYSSLDTDGMQIPGYTRLLTVIDDKYWKPQSHSDAVTKAYLKSLISNHERNDGPKTIPNRLNIIFLTGSANPFNTNDRRFFILQEGKPLQPTPRDDYLLSHSNRLERAVALKNLLLKHQISSSALEAV